MAGVLAQVPRSVGVDELVGTVAGRLDQPHGAGVVARVVGLGNRVAVGRRLLEQAAVIRVLVGQIPSCNEVGRSRGYVYDVAHQVCVDLGHKLVEVQVEVVDPGGQLRGVVVAQIGGIEMFEVGRGAHERASRFRHLLAVDREETVDMNLLGQAEAGRLEHGGPEQRVEIGDVLADEVVDFGVRVAPPVVELLTGAIAPFKRRGHVADGRVEPDVPVVARAIGDFEAEVGRGA